jgi:hypothetical protein
LGIWKSVHGVQRVCLSVAFEIYDLWFCAFNIICLKGIIILNISLIKFPALTAQNIIIPQVETFLIVEPISMDFRSDALHIMGAHYIFRGKLMCRAAEYFLFFNG